MIRLSLLALLLCLPFAALADEQKLDRFEPMDVFELEYADDPQLSPDGEHIVYVRRFYDVMSDRQYSNLWIVNFDGSGHRPLTSGLRSDSSPRWSPDGERLAYVSSIEGGSELYCRWMDDGAVAKLTNLTEAPHSIAWSPDGSRLAFLMKVPDDSASAGKLPPKPEGAEWAKPAKVIDRLIYRSDGGGFIDPAYTHLFLLPAEGGTPRQVTDGDFDIGGTPQWTSDGASVIVSSNTRDDHEYDPLESNLYEVSLADGAMTALTGRKGPDFAPQLSPDGSAIAYLGYDDKGQSYHRTYLYIMDRASGAIERLDEGINKSVGNPQWSPVGDGVYLTMDDDGVTKLIFKPLDGPARRVAADMGGTTLGRPYPSGSYTVARQLDPDCAQQPENDVFVFTKTSPQRPADLATGYRTPPCGSAYGIRTLTALNDDLFGHKSIAHVEKVVFESRSEGDDGPVSINGWVAYPPGFDESEEYPLILEIHGGPHLNYGPRFSAEVQLMAAAGYVVLYVNPRGSTSRGERFARAIDKAFPGVDYDDLMAGVDYMASKPYIDEDNLFVTGGSGGGILTAWIVTKTDRFAAAVSAKPVINWFSHALTADAYNYFYQYWFSEAPWENYREYMDRSPIVYADQVSTPTMLLTGEVDYRTPMSESEQFYQALKLNKVDSMLVRIPDASHSIAARPSNLIEKVAHILFWFDKYNTKKNGEADSE